MKQHVSRERARKARLRHKKAGRNHIATRQAMQRPGLALWIAISTWFLLYGAFRGPAFLRAATLATEDGSLLGADAVMGAIIGISLYLYLLVDAPHLLARISRITLMTLITILSAALGSLLLYVQPMLQPSVAVLVPFALPFALAPLLGTLLLGAKAGIAIGTLATITLAIYADHHLPLLVCGLLATMLVCNLAPNARTRARVMRITVLAGITLIPAVLMLAILQPTTLTLPILAAKASTCIAAAFLAGVIALLLLPVLEHLFHISSNITLLECCDLGHPLLQRMAIEAPGTYHHSLIVANIAQAAAEAIGANSLEARVSAYFHDIGKLTKPAFFAENICVGNENPHNQLNPNMSTLIITAHVKEGISLAMLHKLPACALRAIREHHGTSVLQCFHHKALTQQLELNIGTSSTPPPIDDSQFRYTGPRPTTRISGIICLADAVEAASRSLEKPTPGHLETLVADIFRSRIEDGQLDDCQLSLVELSRIRQTFVFTLANMLHGRVAYPVHENHDLKIPTPDPGGSPAPATTGSGAAAAGKTT